MSARIEPCHVAALVKLLDGEPLWPIGMQVRVLQDAIADTHPKDGDVKQAPLVSGDGSEGNRP